MGEMCNSEKVVYQATIFIGKIVRKRGFILESQLEIENGGSTIIETIFPILYLKPNKPIEGGLGI